MTLKTGMLVGIVGSADIGVLIQIRSVSNTCVIKLNNGSLKKNVPLEDVEEARDMSDTKENKSPIRLGATELVKKSPAKLAALSVDTDNLKTLTLQVGDAVRARANGGSRWFPGRIIRVHRDGVYDVQYSDGDVEKKMASVDLEAVSKMETFRVDERVKARYKGGNKLFPGQIQRVHSDGTYDVLYEDGDEEKRVKAEWIEAIEDTKTRREDEKKRVTTKQIRWQIGDRVKAYYGKGKRLFPGQIVKVSMNGTYDIKYDDGDSEARVDASLIEAVESSQDDEIERVNDNKESETPKKKKKSSLKVGDIVNAPFQGGTKLFRGRISRVRSDGTVDVAFEDGDKDTHVPVHVIQSEEREQSVKKVDFEARDSKKSEEVGTYKTKKKLQVRDKVRARYNKGSKMFHGEITAVHRDGTYDIRYDDGDKEKHVEAKDIELQEDEQESESLTKSSRTLKVGDPIETNYKNGVKLFPGKISRVHLDGTFDITFDDGDSERRVARARIKSKMEEERSSPKKNNDFVVGDVIKARFKNGTAYFPGKIARLRADGTFDIEYDDGDRETRVDASQIVRIEAQGAKGSDKSSTTATKSQRFVVGDVIQARYKKGTKLFSGEITRVRSDGTYDIRYDDGETETHVESSNIESGAKISSQSKADDKKLKDFAVGDKVNARYKGGLKTFPGKIVKFRMDGTYDIEYDDGDMELRVKRSALELIPGNKTKKVEAKDDFFGDSESDDKTKKNGKKSVTIKVGDIVEANFKQKGKFHRGKIVRVRSDGSFDIEYDVGASESHVRIEDIKKFDENQATSDDNSDKIDTKKTKHIPGKQSSDSDRDLTKVKPKKKAKLYSPSESSGSDSEKNAHLKKGARVTYRKAENSKFRRVGTIRKVHSDGSCDVKYADRDTSKRVARQLLVECSESEGSEDDSRGKRSRKTKEVYSFRRHERVLSNWRRSSKFSKPRMTDKWIKATVLEKNSDETYTIRYSDGVVEEDVPPEALKPVKKKKSASDSEDSSGNSTASRRRRKTKLKGSNGIGTESLFLLEQLAMTLFEEGSLKMKPKLRLLREDNDSSSSGSSSSSSTSGSESLKSTNKRNAVDKVLKRLFDSSSLQNFRRMFKEKDVKNSGKLSLSRIIGLVEEFIALPKDNSRYNEANNSVNHILTEWFATHDDLRIHRHFEFKTLMLAFAYTKYRLGKLRMEQNVATVLEGRFASYHENKRQLELWQQKLGYRLFETLQRHFHDNALPHMIPSRIFVSKVSLIFDQVARQAVPNKPLDVYLQQQQLFPHHTLLLPEFLCCYYQLYGSEQSTSSRWSGSVELRPIAFVASCLYSNGDHVCRRHGDLVRRLSVGRTQAQADLILRFREAFESLLSTDTTHSGNSHEESLLETSQLSAFAAKVAADPSQLEPALTTLRKRSGAVSLVEIYGSCGFIIDELISAPTIRNVVERMRMRVELADARRIIGLVRNICVKILRFPNNADYWRLRADSAAFEQKIGRFDGASSLLEAVGFVEHEKTHYELRGARNSEGKRVSGLEKTILDSLREKCVQLDGELALFDGVESLSSILQKISTTCEREGNYFTLEECQMVLTNLSLYIENVLKNPKDSKCWRIREANSTFQRQIGYLPYAMELMESIGFDLVQTLHGNVYTLRGTGLTTQCTKYSEKDRNSAASLSNFAFSSVNSQMEWFLWRRKQEIDSLLEDEMRYLHDIVDYLRTNSTSAKENVREYRSFTQSLVKMYPYGTNALDTFNKTSIQRLQLDMIRDVFKKMDIYQKGFLTEADFSRRHGTPTVVPFWSRFEAFDIGKDDKVDIHDLVAALGPLLDHMYELTTDKTGQQVAVFSGDDTESTLCEATSLAVGNLRLETSCAVAAKVLESLLNYLYSIIQEPENSSLWVINETTGVESKFIGFSAGRELLHLVGFREVDANNSGMTTRNYELQPQRVRFKTSKTVSEISTSLDTATTVRIQTIAAILAGHHRGLQYPSVSDVSAVSRAISSLERCSEKWLRVVQLAVKCLKNIEIQPENPRYRELHTATNTFTKVVGCVQGGLELLLSIGFRETKSGTLVIPLDTSLDEMRARRLELDVGLAILQLRLTSTTNKSLVVPQKLSQSTRATPFTTQKSARLNTRTAPLKQRLRTVTDPIEQEILADFPQDEVKTRRGTGMRTLTRERSSATTLSPKATMMHHNRVSLSRKQVQRRAPNKPPSANGHTMVLAANASAGAETIVVHKGEFILRGGYVRIGAEIPDLCEERMVVEVSNTDALDVTKLRLGIPLRFFHSAKELVSSVLIPSVELSMRLEISETQMFMREIIGDIIVNVVKQASLTMTNWKPRDEMEPEIPNLATLVTSFECMTKLPITLPNVRVGPSMRYMAAWNGGFNSSRVSIFTDQMSDRKLQVYWEGLCLQTETSSNKVHLGDVRRIIRRNAHLSLLLSTATHEMENKLFSTKSDDFEVNYEGFRAFFHLDTLSKNPDLGYDEEARLQLSLAYLKKHFQILLQAATSSTNGYKSVLAFELLRRVYKDVQDHPPIVSDDPYENQTGLEVIQTVCQHLEKEFVDSQRSGQISWPELVYFVRYDNHLRMPEVFPSTGSQLTLEASEDGKRACGSSKVAEVVCGTHTSRVLVLYLDGNVEVWNLLGDSTVLESKAMVLFSIKNIMAKRKENRSAQDKTFMQAWLDANQTDATNLAAQEKQPQRPSSCIHKFIHSTESSGVLARFCAWDSVLCVNSSILQEPGSGSFRFFHLTTHFVSPIRQVAVEHVKMELPLISGKDSTKRVYTKKTDSASSSGVVKSFQVTTDVSKIVFLTRSEAVLWVACAGTGEILCHANLQVAPGGKFQTLLHLVDKRLHSGEIETQLYATTSAKSYRHVGMWLLPFITKPLKLFTRKKVFSFGKMKTTTVVHLVVNADLLFVACRDGAITVWSTSTAQLSPILPLLRLEIPLHNEKLQSICCQTFGQEYTELRMSKIQVRENAAADIEQWEAEVLQRFNPPPLRFALYLFDDGEVIRLAVSEKFDVRLATLDDPEFEFAKFLAPVSGVEQNQARRVTLQKPRTIRVMFVALYQSRDGIFAQKSVQEFFSDFEKHAVFWQTRDEMMKFALSYHENVHVELQIFYTHGDSEQIELTQPQLMKENSANKSAQNTCPVLTVGAVLKSHAGDQTQFQAWKFAMNWLTDDVYSELYPAQSQLQDARRMLAMQSSYRLEADRVLCMRKDVAYEEQLALLKNRRAELIERLKGDVRDIIAQVGRPEEAANSLLNTMNIFMLASFASQQRIDPVEAFAFRLFNHEANQNTSSSLVDLSSFITFIRRERASSFCFSAWIERVMNEMLDTGKRNRIKGVTWNWLNLVLQHTEACSLTAGELGSLFVELDLAHAYASPNYSIQGGKVGFPTSSSLPTFIQRLHRFVCSTGSDNLKLESTMDQLFPPRIIVEFIVECINFSGFFRAKMTELSTHITGLENTEYDQNNPEASYAIQLKVCKWQRDLRQLAQSQNELYSEISGNGDVLKATIEDLQQLQRFLRTSLPSVPPKVSSITLENRCDTICCRDRFVMTAIGRIEGVEAEFVPLSVFYVIMRSGEKAKREFQEELTFLRKVQHLRAREFFISLCLDIKNVPILPTPNRSMVYGGDTAEIRSIVAESLHDWNSLTECLTFMRLSSYSFSYWKPLLWFWSIRVLMALLSMQNERFSLTKGVDMDMLVVSPDGSELRFCSLCGGSFSRFGEKDEDADSLISRETAKIFGFFIYELLYRTLNNEDNGTKGENIEDMANSVEQDVDDVTLGKMRNQLLRWHSGKVRNGDICDDHNNQATFLTDFSSISQIAACGGSREDEELERLCELALLGLQPANNRPGIQSLWMYAGRPGMELISEESVQLNTLSRHLITLVGIQRPLDKLLQDLYVCIEECNEDSNSVNNLQRVVENWVKFLKQLFQLKTLAFDCGDKKDIPNTRIFAMTLRQTLEKRVPYQLCAISLRMFTQCCKRGDREKGRKAVETLLLSFENVLELVEASTNFDELRGNSLLITTVQQILDCLVCVANGYMPPSCFQEDVASTTFHFHQNVAIKAVLWRLSEPLISKLLAIEMTSSRFAIVLRWLDSRRPLCGFHSTVVAAYDAAGEQPNPNLENSLWWNNHVPLIPRLIPSSAVENELSRNEYNGAGIMTTNYLRCVYETKEIEFKLTSGGSVPKFRLAALQQFFGPVFFERKRCFPLVVVRSLVAKVWKDLRFERLICTLLRDRDEKMVMGALSLLECSTRVFRFNPLRSAQIGSELAAMQTPSIYSCPERDLGLNLCSQSVVIEVKRVLEKTIRALKVLGESGTSSASRSQHPLVAILCVGLAWLVNCVHGGDRVTQFWAIAGMDQLLLAHCKANSLPFVKVKDSNMMKEVFRQGQRLVQENHSKWRVFTLGTGKGVNHLSAIRNCSPFRLMLEELVFVASNRAVGLMRTLLLSRTFREMAAGTDDPMAARDLACQRDLISSTDYGKVSHAIELARDVTQLNGTINEQVQVVLYTKALFLHHTATSTGLRVNVLAQVCKEIWNWVEDAWQTVALQSISDVTGNDDNGEISRSLGDVVILGFSLLHVIISHPALSIDEIIELTTFETRDTAEIVNVLYKLVCWITELPNGGTRRRGSTISVLIDNAVALLTNVVQSRRYDDVALATTDKCVDIRALLELLGADDACATRKHCSIVSINDKQQLWGMLLNFDSRTVTSRILETDFLNTVVFLRLVRLDMGTRSTESQIISLNQRLEAAMFLETLVSAASGREQSVNIHLLFAESCKLVLHHDLIAKEANFLRTRSGVSGSSSSSFKHVALCKRVMQLVCCLCVDFTSQSPSCVFLDQLALVGIPAWVVTFHQAHQLRPDSSNNDDRLLLTRVEIFWQDWQGIGAVKPKATNRALMFNSTNKSKAEKTLPPPKPTSQRVYRLVSETSDYPRIRRKSNAPVNTKLSDEDSGAVTIERPLVSPVKVAESEPIPPHPKRITIRSFNVTNKTNPSVIQTLLSIDAESAGRLVNRSAKPGGKYRKDTSDDEALDSDAYSPLPGSSSSEEETQKTRRRADLKAKTKRKRSEEKKSGDAKINGCKLESECDGSRSDDGIPTLSDSNRQKSKKALKTLGNRLEIAAPRQTQQLETLRGVFRKYDVDGDGVISFIDLRRAMEKQMDHRLSDLEIQRWISEKDHSGQGVVSFEDFAVAFRGQVQTGAAQNF